MKICARTSLKTNQIKCKSRKKDKFLNKSDEKEEEKVDKFIKGNKPARKRKTNKQMAHSFSQSLPPEKKQN